MERTAEGYAVQLPLLATTDKLPGVSGLPEVRTCTPTAFSVRLPSGKEAEHATSVMELCEVAKLAKRRRLVVACRAHPPAGQLPLLSKWSAGVGRSPTLRLQCELRQNPRPAKQRSSCDLPTAAVHASGELRARTAPHRLTSSMCQMAACCGCRSPTNHSLALPAPTLQCDCPAAAGSCWQASRKGGAVQQDREVPAHGSGLFPATAGGAANP